MQNAEEECGIREKRGEASWRWIPEAELSGEHGEAVSGCRIQPQLSPLLRMPHSSSAFCIGSKSRIPHSSSAFCIGSKSRIPHSSSAFCIGGEIPYPAFISPLPTLPLEGAGFARWPLGTLSRSLSRSLRGSDELPGGQRIRGIGCPIKRNRQLSTKLRTP